MADESTLKIIIDAENRAKEKIAEFNNNLESAKDKIESMKPVFQKMALIGTAAFGAIVGIVGTSIKAYANAEAAMGRVDSVLKTMDETIKKSGMSFDEVRGKIIEASKAAIQLGFDDEDAAESITKFYQRTGDLTEAMKLNSLTMDLARAKQVDLGTATNWVNLVLSGSGRILKQYGLAISEESTPLEQLAELQKLVGGQAEVFAGKIQGQTEILQVSIANLREEIGERFAPMLSELFNKIVPVIEKMMEWIEKNPELTKKIIIISAAVSALVAGIGLLGLALPGIIAGFTILLGPVGLVILAITSLTVAVGLLFARWQNNIAAFREIWGAFTSWVKSGLMEIEAVFHKIIDPIVDTIEKIKNALLPANISGTLGNIGSFLREKVLGFQQGGIVPGQIGAPVLATVHGGERIIPAGRNSSGNIYITLTGNTFMSDEEAAEKIGDRIIRILKMQNRFAY